MYIFVHNKTQTQTQFQNTKMSQTQNTKLVRARDVVTYVGLGPELY